jgi:non-lysosomal glucosylceramidase
MRGLVFDRNRFGAVENEWDGQFVIAALESPGVEVSHFTTFDPKDDGKRVWESFARDGVLAGNGEDWVSSGENLAGAITVRFTLKPGERRTVPMVIAWDLPIVEFGSGRKWYRRYTDFYGTTGTKAWDIARDGLLKSTEWSDAIDAWQAPYVNDESKPLCIAANYSTNSTSLPMAARCGDAPWAPTRRLPRVSPSWSVSTIRTTPPSMCASTAPCRW